MMHTFRIHTIQHHASPPTGRGDVADDKDDDDSIETDSFYDVVVCGAGAAGASFARTFAETTSKFHEENVDAPPPSRRVLLLDRAGCVKTVERVERVTRRASVYGARVEALGSFRALGVATASRDVAACDAEKKTVTLDDGRVVRYGALCVATGATPRCPLPETCDGRGVDVYAARDVESAEALARRVRASARAASTSSTSTCARRIALVGNGGIALELVDALCGRGLAVEGLESCELVWLVKSTRRWATRFSTSTSRISWRARSSFDDEEEETTTMMI